MFTNGSTAMECGGGLNVGALSGAAGFSSVTGFEIQSRSASSPATATTAANTAVSTSGLRHDAGAAADTLAVDIAETAGGLIAGGSGARSRIASISLTCAALMSPAWASTHCDSPRKYSSAGVSGAESIRKAIIGRFFEDARSVSLLTCEDAMALSDSTSTKVLAPLIARTMASAYLAPGFTSRGAIQQAMPCRSSASTKAVATAASCEA